MAWRKGAEVLVLAGQKRIAGQSGWSVGEPAFCYRPGLLGYWPRAHGPAHDEPATVVGDVRSPSGAAGGTLCVYGTLVWNPLCAGCASAGICGELRQCGVFHSRSVG